MNKVFHVYLTCVLIANLASTEMTLELARKLSQITTVEEFDKLSEKSNDNVTGNRTLAKSSRTGSKTKNNDLTPEADTCSVRNMSYRIKQPDQPSLFYWPMCIRLPRCGGCPLSEKYDCVPITIRKKVISVQLSKTTQTGTKFQVIRTDFILVDEHVDCSIKCKVQGKHCNTRQTYIESKCECRCTNQMETCKSSMRWDSTACRCVCIQIDKCGQYYIFNQNTCQCELNRKLSSVSESGERSKAVSSNCRTKICPPFFEPFIKDNKCLCRPKSH